MVQKNALEDVMREIAIMKKIQHKNIIRLHEVINDDQEDKLYLVLDLAEQGQLIEWDPETNRFFFLD